MRRCPSPPPFAPATRAETGAPEPAAKPGAPAEDGPPGAGTEAAEAEPAEVARDGAVEPVDVALPEIGPIQDPEEIAACTAELTRLGVLFERLDPIEGAEACGARRPLRVTAVGAVEMRPAIEVRCPVARSLALWIDRVVAPLSLLYLNDRLSAVVSGTDYHCRERRGTGSGKISEHAFANALDVMGLAFASGKVMMVDERSDTAGPERSLQAAMRGGACAVFTTVLGPQTNVAHSDHFHLDMAASGRAATGSASDAGGRRA